jgi:hypothetical protein
MGLAGLRAAHRRPGAVLVKPARRKTAMTVLRMAVMTWADDRARSRCASSCKVTSRIVQGLDLPVAAGRSDDGLRPAAALDGAAGDAEGGDGGAELAAVRVTDGPAR